MTKPMLVEYLYYWAIRRYGYACVTKIDLKEFASRKLYGAWFALAHRGEKECGIIRSILARRRLRSEPTQLTLTTVNDHRRAANDGS